MIQFFGADTPNNQKIAIALLEMGLRFEIKLVDLSAGDQNDSQFARINPNRKTPAIFDPNGPGGRPLTLFESAAILLYLGEKSGRFVPNDPVRKWTTIAWTVWQAANLGPTAGQAWHFAPKRNHEAYATGRFLTEGRRLWRVMDERLQQSQHIGDMDFTVADMAVLPWAVASRRLLALRWDDFPNVHRWWKSVMARPLVSDGMGLIRSNKPS